MRFVTRMGLVTMGGICVVGVGAFGQEDEGGRGGGGGEVGCLAVVRWVNEAGGDWNEPSNWDAERVPLDGEAVVFDLPAAYTVTLCGARPAMWAWLRVDRSEVVFDLCGSAMAYQPEGLSKWTPVIEIVGDSEFGAGVVFTNGVVFDPGSWLLDAEMLIDGSEKEVGIGGGGRWGGCGDDCFGCGQRAGGAHDRGGRCGVAGGGAAGTVLQRDAGHR